VENWTVGTMDIQRMDMASVIVTIFLLLIWYITLTVFNYPLMSILMLWIGMSILSILYFFIYRKKKRDMRILKMRFLVSVVPIYSALVFYVYVLLNRIEVPAGFRLLPIGIIGTMLLLNAGVVYYYSRNK
jgi:LPXTG-motif cell wall-anchored protein